MTARTHALMGTAAAALASGAADPLSLGIAALASQLPDADTSHSLAGRILRPLSHLLERHFPHRTVTHSFLATAIVAFLAWPLRWHSPQLWKAALWGYFCGWFADAFTKSGVAAFYPLSAARLVIPANPRLRLATGSKVEHGIFILLVCLLAFALHLNTKGGLLRTFGSWMGQPESVAELFRKDGASRRVLAQVEGRYATTGAPVSGLYEVVDVIGEGIVVRAEKDHLYLAGRPQSCSACQLWIDRVRGRLSGAVVSTTRELRIEGRRVGEVIAALRTKDGGRVWLSGELALEDAELLSWPVSLSHFNSVTVSGGGTRTLRLQAAAPADLEPAADYYATGQLLVREVRDVR
jgi:inner membrane protein